METLRRVRFYRVPRVTQLVCAAAGIRTQAEGLQSQRLNHETFFPAHSPSQEREGWLRGHGASRGGGQGAEGSLGQGSS